MNRPIFAACAALALLAGCTGDTTRDFGIDNGDLSAMEAGIWIDPNGCDHWIIDDGVEGYLTPRVRPDGMPVCREESKMTSNPDDNVIGFDRQLIGEN